MSYFAVTIVAGFMSGSLLAFLAFHYYNHKKLEKERFQANVRLYHEVLLKQKDKNFQYSEGIRKVVNRVHVALLVEHRDTQTIDPHH